MALPFGPGNACRGSPLPSGTGAASSRHHLAKEASHGESEGELCLLGRTLGGVTRAASISLASRHARMQISPVSHGESKGELSLGGPPRSAAALPQHPSMQQSELMMARRAAKVATIVSDGT